MRKPIIKKWEYEVKYLNPPDYGFELTIWKEDTEIYRRKGYGSIGNAEDSARKFMLLHEFDMAL